MATIAKDKLNNRKVDMSWITGLVAAAALFLATTGALADDDDGCWLAYECITDRSEWDGDAFWTYYTNICDRGIYMRACLQSSTLKSGKTCEAFHVRPGETGQMYTYSGPTGQYAFAWVGSANIAMDWVCSRKWGLRDWEPDW